MLPGMIFHLYRWSACYFWWLSVAHFLCVVWILKSAILHLRNQCLSLVLGLALFLWEISYLDSGSDMGWHFSYWHSGNFFPNNFCFHYDFRITYNVNQSNAWFLFFSSYSKEPIIRTGTYASSAVHTMYCQNCPMFGTYNRSFRVGKLNNIGFQKMNQDS